MLKKFLKRESNNFCGDRYFYKSLYFGEFCQYSDIIRTHKNIGAQCDIPETEIDNH